MRRAALVALAVAGCKTVRVPALADAGPDSALHLPDAFVAGDPCAGPIALADLGACLDQAWCARLEACGWGARDGADCSDLPDPITGGLSARDLAPAVQAVLSNGRVVYDPAAARACVDAIATTACHDVAPGAAIPFDGCGALIGYVFGSCAYPFECASGTACVEVDTDAFQPDCGGDDCEPEGAIGDGCGFEPCVAGAHCVAANGVLSCLSGDVGASCNTDTDCDDDLWCDSGGMVITDGSGTCSAPDAAGASCASDRQCAGDLRCVGDALEPAAGVCTDTSVAGAACDDRCTGLLLCAVPAAGALGTCVAAPDVGAPCVAGAGCGAFLRCGDDGTCAAIAIGSPCTPGSCSPGLVCTADVTGAETGTCVAPLLVGQGCTDGGECASSSCPDGVCEAFTPCGL